MNALALVSASEEAPATPRLTGGAFLAALTTLGLGLIAPSLALFAAAMAGANALFRRDGAPLRFPLSLIGPLGAAALVGALWGLDGAMGVLFVWRVWADARWSQLEARRLGARETLSAKLALWSTPALGIAVAAYTAPHVLAGLPLDLPHVPLIAPIVAGVIAAALLFDWGLARLADWRLGTLARAPGAHLLTHHALFLAAYAISPDISSGLMALIVWRLMHASARAPQASLTAVP